MGKMDLTGLTVFRHMEQKMAWLSARQSVLAENVANADTPGYRASDLAAFGSKSGSRLPMAVTNVSHMAAGGVTGGKPQPQRDRFAIETAPNGNQVSLEEQLTKVGETGMDYQFMTNLYRKNISMLKTAMGRGSNA
jgi:flagellar basal-body rod protein FlgB